MKIYHIADPEIWESAKSGTLYEAESLAREGFIHCSFADQVEGVLARYFGSSRPVVILEIETDRLRSRLVEEASTNEEIYPHIYGGINTDAVTGEELRRPG